jgi:hypothetical protein
VWSDRLDGFVESKKRSLGHLGLAIKIPVLDTFFGGSLTPARLNVDDLDRLRVIPSSTKRY